jgi:hypothetical protein
MAGSRLVVLCSAALLASACSAPASRTAESPDADNAASASGSEFASAPTVTAAAEDDPIVCKSVTRTGTRVAERICMRRSTAEKQQRDAREMLGEVQRRGNDGNPVSD